MVRVCQVWLQKKEIFLTLTIFVFWGGGKDGANMGDFISEWVYSQQISMGIIWVGQLSRILYELLVPELSSKDNKQSNKESQQMLKLQENPYTKFESA